MPTPNYKDLSGQIFDRLTAISRNGKTKSGNTRWLCHCNCGNKITVTGSKLTNGHTRSCGCYRHELQTKHSHATKRNGHTITYNTWHSMIQRCQNSNNDNYKNYGGRGITIQKSWLVFENFLIDMGERPSIEYTLHRKDNDKGYSKDNCKWALISEQSNIKRSCIYLEFDGKKLNLMQWSKLLGIRYQTLRSRYRHGWSTKAILTTPISRR